MLHRAAIRRPGITLLEVLTAIFIMGIGLLAILTLFPLGALSMARAVRDDRAAHIVANAAAIVTALDLRNDAFVTDGFHAAPPGPNDRNGPSNIVFVDPAYVALNGDPYLGYDVDAMGNPTTPLLPAAAKFAGSNGVVRVAPAITRDMTQTGPSLVPRPTSYSPQSPFARHMARWFTFQDEIQFEKLGVPVGWSATWVDTPPPNGSGTESQVRRPSTYTWACMIRRPRYSSQPLTYPPPAPPELAEVTILVYASRSTDLQGGEVPYAVQPVNVIYPPTPTLPKVGYSSIELAGMSVGSSTIELNHGGNKPNIRRGSWLMDITMIPVKNIVNGDFYKVETVTDKDNNVYTIQLDRPIKYPWSPPAPVGPPQTMIPFVAPRKAVPTTMVHLENVIAVVEKATSWNP